MTANIVFPNVTAYEVTKFDVRLGEPVAVNLSPDAVGTARWFADRDQSLNIVVKDGGASADITATASGSCEIQIQVAGAVVLTLFADVFNPAEATTLGASIGAPEPK